jgi:hypothetical protein
LNQSFAHVLSGEKASKFLSDDYQLKIDALPVEKPKQIKQVKLKKA